jgi:hypothetical protein
MVQIAFSISNCALSLDCLNPALPAPFLTFGVGWHRFCGFAGLASVKPEARSETGSNSFHKAVQGAGQVAESLGVESRFSVG